MNQNDRVIKNIEDTFFGERFLKQTELTGSILACRSYRDFKKLKVDLASDEVSDIYATASFKDVGYKDFLRNKSVEAIFAALKPVRAPVDFI